MCMAESLSRPPETITTLLIGYNSNIKLKVYKKIKQKEICFSAELNLAVLLNFLNSFEL